MSVSGGKRGSAAKRIVKMEITDLGITLYAAYSRRHDRLYLIVPGMYCSCPSFLFEVYLKGEKEKCIHLEGLESVGEDQVPVIKLTFSRFKEVFYPLIFRGFL